MSDTLIREHVRSVLMDKLQQSDENRSEALREFFGVTMGGADVNTVDKLAELVPPIMPTLYDKWIGMFIERLFETVPMEQLQELCSGTADNNATLVLIYIMFLESERMEKQIDEDLKEYGLEQSGGEDMGDMAASYIRAKMTQLGHKIKKMGENE